METTSGFRIKRCALVRNDGCTSDHRQLAVDHQQYPIQLMAAAQDQAASRDHAVHALLAREPWIFLDPIERNFRGTAEDRENRAVAQEVDGIVAPLTVRDHASVQIQDAVEFEAIERHPARLGGRSGLTHRGACLAWIGILRNQTHGTSPVISVIWST